MGVWKLFCKNNISKAFYETLVYNAYIMHYNIHLKFSIGIIFGIT